ncbi:hypothetical protein SUGI_1194260 [Cryptomeria japonica]|nr:hypothetical protein SUGI_1194260 [Cryptomeria japonica]
MASPPKEKNNEEKDESGALFLGLSRQDFCWIAGGHEEQGRQIEKNRGWLRKGESDGSSPLAVSNVVAKIAWE